MIVLFLFLLPIALIAHELFGISEEGRCMWQFPKSEGGRKDGELHIDVCNGTY